MFDPVTIIKTAGLIGIFLVVFAETGIFFCFFLPGDTLLFSAGIFALQGFFPLWILIVCIALASILGNIFGYETGRRVGRKLFEREASFLFNMKRVYEAEQFYKKYGSFTIVLARFIPVVRTLAPIVAGVGHMPRSVFFIYNIIGAVIWATVVPLAGYYLGSLIPNPERYILPVVFLAVGVSLTPVLYKVIQYYLFRRS
jgi:membrane-associated protein